MPTRKEVLDKLSSVSASNKRLTLSDMDLEPNVAGERSVVASYQANRPLRIRQKTPMDMHLVVHETATTDGSGDEQTISLEQDLIDADGLAEPVVLYADDTVAEPESIDYAAGEITYTDDGDEEELDIYYAASDQARVEIRASAPRNHQKTLMELDAGLVNHRDQSRDSVDFDFDAPLKGVLPKDWTLEVAVTAPYNITWDHDDDGEIEATNAILDIPIKRSAKDVSGLEEIVIQAIP